jgi:hypothetical protein
MKFTFRMLIPFSKYSISYQMRITLATILIVISQLAGCSRHTEHVDKETAQMAQVLRDIDRQMSPENPFYNRIRVEFYQSQPEPDDPFEKFQYYANIGQEQLYAGNTSEAIETLGIVESIIRQHSSLFPDETIWMLKDLQALTYLRLGEEENCIENPTSESCIIPIRGDGIHQITRGSENAIELYSELLESDFGTLNHQWLMNIAYMTLDQYPDHVPSEFRVPEHIFESDLEFPHFKEIGKNLGIDVVGLSGASIVDDFTGNGFLDIFTTSWSLKHQARLFQNNGDGTFVDITEKAKLVGITGGLQAVHGDYTNNGYPDIYIMRGAWMGEAGEIPNSLLRNNGDGTFTDVTFEAGVVGAFPTQTAAWGDFNHNGLLDLFVGYETTGSKRYPVQLFLNNGDGTFTDVADEVGLRFTGFVKGVVWGDYNNDGKLDLYVSRLGAPNLLYENMGPDEDGHWHFRDIASHAGVQEPLHSFPVWFWDYNNNGFLDLFVASYDIEYDDVLREFLGEEIQGDYPRLYRNNGDGTFSNVTEESKLHKVLYAMGSNFGDLNNDGYPDFYIGSGDPDYRSLMPNRMFLNANGESFHEVTYAGGFGTIQKGHGVSFADLNHNGHQDIYINMGGALEGDLYQNLLFQNPGNDNSWVTLALEGEISNRSALHSRIRIDIEENGMERSVYKTVTSGGSFGGSPFRQSIGLGNADTIQRIEIYWPASDITQVFNDVSINQYYHVREQSDQLTPLNYPAFEFDDSGSPLPAHPHQ